MKNQFCVGDIDILIVCSKLLTGFDAPICQVLYIDKELKEHGLLQALPAPIVCMKERTTASLWTTVD